MATKIVNGQEVELTQTEEDAIIAEWLANKAQQDLEDTPEFKLQQDREREIKNFDTIYKRFALVLLDQFNVQLKFNRDLLAAIAAATSLVNLQSRAAAIGTAANGFPNKTAEQLKNAIVLKD